MKEETPVTEIEEVSSNPLVKKDTQQLDLLLLKAESYSKFILENQQRSQALLVAQKECANKEKKRKSEASSEEQNKRRKIASPEPAKPESDSNRIDQPPNLTGGMLMPHQLEGLQWLLSLWENGLNGILADEM